MSKLNKIVKNTKNGSLTTRLKDRRITIFKSKFHKDAYVIEISMLCSPETFPTNQDWNIVRQINNTILIYKTFVFNIDSILAISNLIISDIHYIGFKTKTNGIFNISHSIS